MFNQGDVINTWRIERLLGRGGFAEVYLAENTYTRDQKALKVMDPSKFDRKSRSRLNLNDFFERIKAETSIANLFDHPNIVKTDQPIIDTFNDKKLVILPMEFLEGGNITNLASTPYEVDKSVEIFEGVLDGVSHIHERGFVHRDLKLANIFLTKKGQAKVGDFGITTLMDEDLISGKYDEENKIIGRIVGIRSREISDKIVFGSRRYMSDEYLYNAVANEGVDIYAAGMIFYQLLVGRMNVAYLPAEGNIDLQRVSVRRIEETMNRYCHDARHLSPIIAKSLAPAGERFESAKDFKKAIQWVTSLRKSRDRLYLTHDGQGLATHNQGPSATIYQITEFYANSFSAGKNRHIIRSALEHPEESDQTIVMSLQDDIELTKAYEDNSEEVADENTLNFLLENEEATGEVNVEAGINGKKGTRYKGRRNSPGLIAIAVAAGFVGVVGLGGVGLALANNTGYLAKSDNGDYTENCEEILGMSSLDNNVAPENMIALYDQQINCAMQHGDMASLDTALQGYFAISGESDVQLKLPEPMNCDGYLQNLIVIEDLANDGVNDGILFGSNLAKERRLIYEPTGGLLCTEQY